VPQPKLDASGQPVPFVVHYPTYDTSTPPNFLTHPNAKSVVAPHKLSWMFLQGTVAILILVGFESVTAMGGEAKNAKHDIPIAVITSLLVQGAFCYLFEYFAANYFLSSGYTMQSAAGSAAPIGDMMVLVGDSLFGAGRGRIFMLVEAFTVFLALIGTTLSCMNTGARVTYAMGKDREVPEHFGMLHGDNLSPHRAIWTLAVISAVIGCISVLMAFGDAGAPADSVIQALHEHVRREVLPPPIPDRDMLVEANHRGYIVDHESEEGLKREIDLAADVGAEMFVIDAGWYGPEPNQWGPNVGDWYAGAWLPNDLNPVREYSRQKGLLFGLWVEIEAIGGASKLRREHPDWVLTRDGKPVAGGRLLDLTKPAVTAWMETEIARIIKKYDLDLFRIDYNSSAEEGGNRVHEGFTENTLWRHVDALYAMFDRLHKQFPHVIFQNCAGGGGRLDLGIMSRFQNTELSDWLRAPRGLKILNGMTWILPPEILLRTLGTESNGPPSDADLVTQLRATTMALPILRGLSPTLADFNPLERYAVRQNIDLYEHVIRPMLKDCRVYHHTPFTPMLEGSPWVVLEYATPDSQKGLGWIFRTDESGDAVYRFTPRGLDLSKTYEVTFSNSGRALEIPGYLLLQQGIPVRLEGDLTSELLIFRAK